MFPQARMFVGLSLLGLAIRSIRHPTVVSEAGVQLPFATDAYYHLRRIWFSVARFPESLPFDRYVSFPRGSEIVWPSTFDWTIAAVLRPFVDPGDRAAVEALAIWVPAVLGAATTGLVGLLAARLYGRGAGWCAGLLYSLLPMSFVYSQLGMIDHHVAVALLGTLVLWLACEVFARADRADGVAAALAAPTARPSAALGALMAVMLLTWPGSLLHLGVLQLAFCLRWWWAADRDRARSAAVDLAVVQAVLALCVAPFTLGVVWRQYGTWSPLVLSSFQPVYFASAAIFVAAAQLLHDRTFLGSSRGRRILSSVGLASSGLLVALVALPALREALLYAGGWFTEAEEMLGTINELRPILARTGSFDPGFALRMFGAGFVVFPLVWLQLARRARAEGSATSGLFLFWTLVFAVLTLQQWRFGNTFAVVYAVSLGAVLAGWASRLRGRFAASPLRPMLEVLAVCALVAWTAQAFGQFYGPILEKNRAALGNQRLRLRGPLRPVVRIYDEAGRWLRRHTPATSGYLDPSELPEYAVLGVWGHGHLLRYRAERPMVQDNFGPYAGREGFEAAAAYFAERDEAAAIGILEGLGVRYVVGGRQGAGSLEGLGADAMAFRLGSAFGSLAEFPPDITVPGLGRHRLIFYAHSGPPGARRRGLLVAPPNESLGIWETVPGARIEGRARPGTPVRLSLEIEVSSGWRHVYRREVLTDALGSYRVVVPYPTDVSFSPDVRVLGVYRFEGREATADLVVRESDVGSGAAVRGPDLLSPPGPV